MHLNVSTNWHIAKSMKILSPVRYVNIIDTGIVIHHIYTLSKRIVISTLPPERRVKYAAFAKAANGIVSPEITIIYDARFLTLSLVL